MCRARYMYISTGKRVIVQNMRAFSDDVIFAISICNIWRCSSSCLYNLLSVHTCHLSRNKGRKSARTFLLEWSLSDYDASRRNILSGERLTVSNVFKLICEIFSSAFIICNMEVATFSNLKWKAFDGAHHSSLMRHITDAGAWSVWLFM